MTSVVNFFFIFCGIFFDKIYIDKTYSFLPSLFWHVNFHVKEQEIESGGSYLESDKKS